MKCTQKEATELQNSLARLAPGASLSVSIKTIERAFALCSSRAECLAAAANVALWYGCEFALCGPGESQALFTRHHVANIQAGDISNR